MLRSFLFAVIRPKPPRCVDAAIPGHARQFWHRLSFDGSRTRSQFSFRIEECRSPSTYRLFTLASWAAVRREAAPGAVGSAQGKVWEFIRSQPGLRTNSYNSFLSVTRHSRARRYCATLVSTSRAHLKLRATYTRPKLQ